MVIVFAPHSFSYCVIVLLPPPPPCPPPSTVPPAPPTPHVTPLKIKPIVPFYASILYSSAVLDAWYQLSGKASSHNGVDHLNPTPSFLKGITVTVSSCPSIHLFRYCPQDIFWTAQLFISKLFMVVHHHESGWFAVFMVKVTLRAATIKIWQFLLYLFLWTSDPFAANLNLMTHHHKLWKVWWKYLIATFTLKVTVKVQNVSGCLSSEHFIIYNQTWYGDA